MSFNHDQSLVMSDDIRKIIEINIIKVGDTAEPTINAKGRKLNKYKIVFSKYCLDI